jgi:cytoskeletal protein RodZ
MIGPQLRQARERLGASVDDLANRTRIRAHVIEGLEADDFGPCGGDFYARGHIRAIGRVLGLDPEPLVRLYDEHYAAAPISPRTVFQADFATGSSSAIHRTGGGPQWGALAATVLVLTLAWGIARIVFGA